MILSILKLACQELIAHYSSNKMTLLQWHISAAPPPFTGRIITICLVTASFNGKSPFRNASDLRTVKQTILPNDGISLIKCDHLFLARSGQGNLYIFTLNIVDNKYRYSYSCDSCIYSKILIPKVKRLFHMYMYTFMYIRLFYLIEINNQTNMNIACSPH